MKRVNNDSIHRIALELSLKPFGQQDRLSYEACAQRVIGAWRPLLEAAAEVSFMLWVADGSEILEWCGDFTQPLEWARYIGFCNAERNAYAQAHHNPSRNAILFTPKPRKMSYQDLRAIITALRTTGAELLKKPISIGATFDPGPEFAESPFKYNLHPEIIVPKRVSGRPTFPMVDATATLHADPRVYAAYPQGIPEGEPFALFLGKQLTAFCHNLGFDYVWLSNGFGFSPVAWDYLGPAFDGESFYPQERALSLECFKQAWENLHSGNPEIPMEVRGSNFAAGMDIAKDGVDFNWLYDTGYIRLPPPNSPWGALNFDFGLELAGFLSRAVRSPKNEYLFRFYPNDPWFWQNPWTDVFYGQAYDIYIPLATSILNGDGKVTTPSTINILTGDTEYGDTDPLTGVQVASHIRTALNDRPDDVGLLTWIYPFEEYHRLAESGADGQAEVFFGDWFVRSLINHGLPVATAATPQAFDAFLVQCQNNPRTILLLPTIAAHTQQEANRLLSWLTKDIPAILYGPAASLHPIIQELLNIKIAPLISGQLTLKTTEGLTIGNLLHDPVASSGGIAAQFMSDNARNESTKQIFLVSTEGTQRAYCVSKSVNGTTLTWLRGTNYFHTRPDKQYLALKPKPHPSTYVDAGRLGVDILKTLGYMIHIQLESSTQNSDALILFSRHDNAWFLSGYAAAPAGMVKLRFPEGAPVFHATHTRIEDSTSHYPLARVMHYECRIFVQQKSGVVGCDTRARDEHHQELTLRIIGLQEAGVTFYPPHNLPVTCEYGGHRHRFDGGNRSITLSGISGNLSIYW